MRSDPDWKALMPHRPVGPGQPGYVARPTEAGLVIAERLIAGTSTIVVAGPVGVGKSSELASAADALQPSRLACLVPLDRFENMRSATAEQVLLRIAGRVAYVAAQVVRPLSANIRGALASRGVLADPSMVGDGFTGSVESLARATLKEAARLAARRITLLVDGLEKTEDRERATGVLDAIGALADEVELVVVVPWLAAYDRSGDIVRAGEHFFGLRAVEVDQPRNGPGLAFFRQMLAARLGVDLDAAEQRSPWMSLGSICDEAARMSGGIPRTFLQIMADEAAAAALRQPLSSPWPNGDELTIAIEEMRESFRRMLLPGDTQAILSIDGTDGRELPLDRKVRLLARGALLERAGPMLRAHPLLRSLIPGLRT
jgi:hypothetical protein